VNRTEHDLQDALLLGLGGGREFRCWRNNVGRARPLTHPETVIQYGRPGMADIFGILRCKSGVGAFVSIEVKSETGKETPEQASWRRMVDAMGGLAVVSRPKGPTGQDISAEVCRVADLLFRWREQH
jgi:hypothetical protein